MWLGRTRHLHFVGIGGIGMSGIAELVANLGYRVSGSDARRSDITDRLASLGVRIDVGHDGRHVADADVVVVSSAIAPDNPEIVAARARHVPVIPRAEMLAELMRLRVGIAVAGAHGKTTTTSMVALMLEHAGLDPTAVIGGRLSAFGSNAKLGRGQYMVVEADESDRSFLKLSPALAVITNIDREHMDTYGSFDRLVEAFRAFADRVPFYGAVVACVDDEAVRALLPSLSRRTITYGFSDDADVRGIAPASDGRSASCDVVYQIRGVPDGTGRGRIALSVPGRHNLQNALAAAAIGLEIGVRFDEIQSALADFRGAERRYQVRGAVAGVTVVDDYGHHPTEIAAVLRAARDGRPGRLVVVFQPHRFSRTRDLLDAFGPALSGADVVVLTDIYAAGEAPIDGVTVDALARAIEPHVKRLVVARSLDAVPDVVASDARAGDLVITLGAGSIAAAAPRILDALSRREARA
ncbi:MAG TPA: UDP-N-acetylmuramate--L-alanine ligase [Vicinamibacterales bacterium]|jgi:UDP-N-acetylmuramate--alanine ligase|nr:UDP-N-acetylmuramate--L-alanine ligase [Vicinamibacterales bacterium]